MFNDKTILVTGGTGSFGKHFIKTVIANYSPKKVIVYSRDELKQYEMTKTFSGPKYACMRYFLGDVRDKDRLMRAAHGVDIIIHAAALKHVPAAEYNPFEFVKTNVMGAQNIIEAAIDRGVKRVVALSTDKACNPINLYGATKLCSDKLFVAGNSYSGENGTRFSVVRYGNVVGSRGSVIPFFLKAKESGTIPITDVRMTRFWITIEQSVQLVFSALSTMQGGEIYVPKIPSMKIMDLAEIVAPGTKIFITGIRPGEKLHESMISAEDSAFTYEYDSYYAIQPAISTWTESSKITGKKVPAGFSYTSDTNTKWLQPDELMDLLSQYRLAGAELVKVDEQEPELPNRPDPQPTETT